MVLHHYKDDQTNEPTNILTCKKKECFHVMKNISIRVEIEARTHGIAMK